MSKENLKSKIYLIFIFLMFIVIMIIYYGHYQDTLGIIKSEYDSKIDLIEQSIYNETKYTEIINSIIGKEIEEEMRINSEFMVDKYENDGNILEWDLKEMKGQFGNMDVYILDKDLEIVNSSVDKEVGLSLNSFGEFSESLRNRLKGNKFVSDSINFSISESELKKYSYIPTRDNKYLIEFSVNIKDLYPKLKDLNIVYLSKDLKDKYPFIEDIRVYKFNKKREYSHELDTMKKKPEKSIVSKEDQDRHVRKALETNKIQEQIIDDNNGNSLILKYIPYTLYSDEDKLTWWESYVIEVLYDNQLMVDEVLYQKKIFLRGVTIISFLYFGFSFMIIYLNRKNQEMINKDFLTKLPNRKKFEEVMKCKILCADRKQDKIVVVFLDVDKFEKINDTFGHDIGDKVLQEFAKNLKKIIPEKDIISRVGGDEFTGLISGIHTREDIEKIGREMSKLFKTNLSIDSEIIPIKASVGFSIYPDHGKTIEELLIRADDAMYEAKNKKLDYKIYSYGDER